MSSLAPRARSTDLIVEATGPEIALHDSALGHFHALNPTASAVWRALDGNTPVDELATRLSLPAPLVEMTLSELAELNLLENPLSVRRVDRREVTKKLLAAGLLGGIVLPSIGSISGADVANAGNVSGDPCVTDPCGQGLLCPGFCQNCLGIAPFCDDCLPADNIEYCTFCADYPACVVAP